MTNVQEFFDKLNNQMKYLDPYKWLLDVEPEHIPEMIEEMEEDIFNLEESINEYDGSLENFNHFEKMTTNSINYKKECIEILKNIKEDYDNEHQTN